MIPTADNHSSISAVFQVGGLCIFCSFSFRYLIMTDFFSTFYFFVFFSDCLNLSRIFIFAKLSPKPQPQLGAEVVIFPVNPTTQPPTRTSLNLASDKVTVKSKVVYLVELDL